MEKPVKIDRYQQLREELGYDDEEIRILAKSIKFKIVGALGSEKERQLSFLMREREKRDKTETKKQIEENKTFVKNYWDTFAEKNRGTWKRSEPLPTFTKRIWKEIQRICNNDASRWATVKEMTQNVFYNSTDTEMLISGREIYRADNEIFNKIASTVKIGRWHNNILLKALYNAKKIYGTNKNKFLYVYEKLTSIFYNNQGFFEMVNENEDMRDAFFQNEKRLELYMKMLQANLALWLVSISDASKICGKNEQRFDVFVELLPSGPDKNDGGAEDALIDAAEVYGDDDEIFTVFADLAREKDNRTIILTLAAAKDMYRNNKKNLLWVRDSIIDLWNGPNGSAAVTALADMKKFYGTDRDKFIRLKNKIAELAKNRDEYLNMFVRGDYKKAGDSKSRINCFAEAIGTSEKRFDVFADLAMEENLNTAKKIADAREIYKENEDKFNIVINYAKQHYPLNNVFISAYVDIALKNPDGQINMMEIGSIYAEKMFEKTDWPKKILEVYSMDEIKPFLPEYLQIFFGVLAQINIAALSTQIDAHFKPFKLADGDFDQKKKILELYGNYLIDFNGIMVPEVWHLYCLLNDPAGAQSYMGNFKDLNNIREIENIADNNDLRKKMHDLKEGVLLGNINPKNYLESSFTMSVLDDMAKVSASDWKRKKRPLSEIIKNFANDEHKILETFDEKTYKSGFIPVIETTVPIQRDPSLTENIAQVQASVSDFTFNDGEIKLMDEEYVLEKIKKILQLKIKKSKEKSHQAATSGLNAKGEKLNNKALAHIQKTLDQLDRIAEEITQTKTLEDIIHILLENKPRDIECTNEIRSIFYYLGAKKQNIAQEDTWLTANPALVEANTLSEFLNDTILHEVVEGKSTEEGPKIKLNKQEKKALRKEFGGLLNFLKQKQEEVESYKKRTTGSTKKLAIVANRGLLAELSGFYCDACWTQQSDILKNNPTMVGHTFVENFENKEKSKIIGGCLTLESSIQVKDNESDKKSSAKVLIVRGLNPQNAYINKYHVEDFVENFLDYVQETARKAGAEYVVLPLDNKGALSNRPQINDYLKKKYGNAERISLNDNIEFNGYGIKNSCVVVRVVKENARKGKLPKPTNVPLEKQEQWIGSW